MKAILRLIGQSLCAAVLLCAAGATYAQCDGDLDGDLQVTIDEILRAVNSALDGCPGAVPTPTSTATPTACAGVFTCTCASGCGNCGVGGDPGDVRENVSCESANDFCLYKDGPCNNPELPGCDGSRIFEHGWTCVPNP